MVTGRAGVSSGDSVGSGGEVGKLAGDGVSRGDSKIEGGWRGKSEVAGGVGDAAWMDCLVDVGTGADDVNAGVVKFTVSDRVFDVEANCGGEIGEGREMTSDIEVKTKVEDGETEGVTDRNLTSVPAWACLDPTSDEHPVIKKERQMIGTIAFVH